jgi:hypothetical protein
MRVLGLKGNRISAGAFLRNESADILRNSDEDEQRAKHPSERAVHEASRDKPFECERRKDR